MVHLKCLSTECMFWTSSDYVLNRHTELSNHSRTTRHSSPTALNPSVTTWPPGNATIEPLSHAPFDIHYLLTTSGNIVGEAPDSFTLDKNEVLEYVFVVVCILNDIIPLGPTAVVNNLMTHLYAIDFFATRFYRHVQTAKVCLCHSGRRWESQLHGDCFKKVVDRYPHEGSELQCSMYRKDVLEVIPKASSVCNNHRYYVCTKFAQHNTRTGT